jgi:dihydropteroate synthase
MSLVFHCRDRILSLDRPVIMGILNITPDSFFDGGQYAVFDYALEHASKMLAQGAEIIDIGGESTRPGSASVSSNEQIDRVLPVVEAIARNFPQALISVDTSDPLVMAAAIQSGAHIINDVRALSVQGAIELIAQTNIGVCLMHMQGTPSDMQIKPSYTDVLQEVRDFLADRAKACILAGIQPQRIIIDPGVGFGKSLLHNLAILNHVEFFLPLGFPVLVGASRKSMIGQILNAAPSDRLYGSLGAHVMSVVRGARLIRTHDVKETKEAIDVAFAIMSANEKLQSH